MEVRVDGVKYVPMQDVPTDKGLLEALEVRFSSDAGDNITVREYLCKLLMTLWEEGECFSGKRPFGNSGWERDLYKPLIAGGFIIGELDGQGYVDTVDSAVASAYVCNLILAAFYGAGSI